MKFWIDPLLRLLGLLALSAIIALLFDLFLGAITLLVILVGIHVYHLLQLHRLHTWLIQSREEGTVAEITSLPDAFGVWGDTFAAMFRLHRAERIAQRHLTATLEHLRQAAEAFPEGVVLLDKHFRIEWINPQAVRDLGLNPARDQGTLVTHLLRDPEFIAYLPVGGNAITIQRPGDPARILSITVVPFAERGRLLISRDISSVERADTVRRDFIANISHELRTPLTVIVGFLENLLEETWGNTNGSPHSGITQARQSALMLMSEQAERMQRLVDDLLTLSRLDEYRSPENEETIDMSAMLMLLTQEGIALSDKRHTVFADPPAGIHLHGNFQELRSAFTNLVSNAIRYTPEGGQVTLRWQVIKNHPVFEVSDTGMGISAEHIPRITERFYRVDKGRSSASGGTGLGLAIVKHVLLRHGAHLEIQSTLGKGSVFRAVFPKDRSRKK